jgi:S-methylmethionine-dependent homocysteine/selenocysteine methylase
MPVQILDGAMGTELTARGVALEGPAWSARANLEASEQVASIHRAYADAGATLHTANTFRTQPRAYGSDWKTALRAAVRLARGSVPHGQAVLGSMAPVEDCYEPHRSPGERSRGEHREVARALADAGCDMLLCETFATEAEARVAVEEALRTGLPVWLSLTAGPFGALLSPTELGTIAAQLAPSGIERLLVNCISATRIEPYVRAVATLGVPFGVYANAGREDEGIGWSHANDAAAASYATLADDWVDLGATVVGGCCGTGPAHSRALAEAFA